jgi:hypothetical protein
MSALNESIAKRVADLVRRLASDFEGEQLNTVAALKRTLKREGLSLSDIAIVIESCNGAIEERKYSDSDAEIIYARGVQKGREEEARNRPADHPPEFYDIDGHPRWNAIALFCQKNSQRLRPAEQGFIDDMAGNTMWREPTEKQAKWLLSIFIRLGGRRQQ